MKPIIKWVGGKRQLLPEILSRMPEEYNRYLEPFLGGGSVLFGIEPEEALVNDLNSELINLYRVVRSYPNALIRKLRVHEKKNSKEYYYMIRGLDREIGLRNLNFIFRASRFVYLNKAGYNGLYRVNSNGYMNVPFGKRENVNLFFEENIAEISEYLNRDTVSIHNQDYYRFVIENVQQGDFVYFDPPYAPVNETSSFTAYQKDGFTEGDQRRLRDLCLEIHERGAYFMLSNSNVELIQELYDNEVFNIEIVQANRVLNSNGKKRGAVEEVIITNYRQE